MDRAKKAPPSRGWAGLRVRFVVVLVAALTLFLAAGCGSESSGPISVIQTADFHALAFGHENAEVVFFGHHNGIMRSEDGGVTWKRLVNRANFDAMGLGVSPSDSRQVYLAGHNIFQKSVDGGATWQPVRHNLPGSDIHGFSLSMEVPDRLYAFVVGFGLFRSNDGGQRWDRTGAQLPGDIMALAAAGGSPEVLYAGSMSAGVLKSTDGGRSWSGAANGLGSRNVMALAVDPVATSTAYAGTGAGLYKSTDAGASWSRLSLPGDNAVSVAVSSAKPQVVLAITVKDGKGLVYRSHDGGSSWGRGR
ncbi:MAG: hypothetical protein HY680_02320 [Chloroflexi bacterium]|nr:hypothetical protein [Chloroflexota bacterium]